MLSFSVANFLGNADWITELLEEVVATENDCIAFEIQMWQVKFCWLGVYLSSFLCS